MRKTKKRIMKKRKMKMRRRRRTRRRHKRGGEKKATLVSSLINLGLVIPQKGINTVLAVYLKFSNLFWGRVKKLLKQIPNQDTQDAATQNANLIATTERVIADPKFQKEWKKTIKIISNVLIIPILLEMVQILEKQGFIVAGSFAKITRTIIITGGRAAIDAILTIVGVIPGLGTVVDIAMLAQLIFHSGTKLTMESIVIVTSLLSAVLAVTGKFFKPFRLAQKKVGNLINVIEQVKNKGSSTAARSVDRATTAVTNIGT